MRRRVYDSLESKPKLYNRNAALQAVNGEPLKLDGCAEIPIEIGRIKCVSQFLSCKTLIEKSF